MNFRTKTVFRLVTSHILPVAGLVALSSMFRNLLLLSISQTVLLITYFSGYWEFFGLKFRKLFFSLSECAVLLVLFFDLRYGFDRNSTILFVVLACIQLYGLILLAKIGIVLFRKDREFVEVAFPFKNGTYLITDGGNSSVSRLMNYHYYAPIHKKNKTNLSMLYATDIVKLSESTKWIPMHNEEYPIFNESLYSPITESHV